MKIVYIYRIYCTFIIGESFWKILNSLDPVADILEDVQKKVSGGEEEFSAQKLLQIQ